MASVQALIEMNEDRTEQKGMARSSAKEKRKAFDALRAWLIDFRAIARVAFKNNPQLLEVYGMPVPSKA